MTVKCKVATIRNSVIYCKHCTPLSGCALSDLKDMQRDELRAHLSTLSERSINHLLSYHDCCPYKDQMAI